MILVGEHSENIRLMKIKLPKWKLIPQNMYLNSNSITYCRFFISELKFQFQISKH